MSENTLFEQAFAAGTDTTLRSLRLLVPLLAVRDLSATLRFYVEGLDFRIVRHWSPAGTMRWCWLERDGVAVMLQQHQSEGATSAWAPPGSRLCLFCADALAIYREARARGLEPAMPFVGNGLWVTTLTDPEGHRLDFESPTEVPEHTVFDPAAQR